MVPFEPSPAVPWAVKFMLRPAYSAPLLTRSPRSATKAMLPWAAMAATLVLLMLAALKFKSPPEYTVAVLIKSELRSISTDPEPAKLPRMMAAVLSNTKV